MSRHGIKLGKPDKNGIMICPESKFRYKEIKSGILKCINLDEETPLPPEMSVGKNLYDEFKIKEDN